MVRPHSLGILALALGVLGFGPSLVPAQPRAPRLDPARLERAIREVGSLKSAGRNAIQIATQLRRGGFSAVELSGPLGRSFTLNPEALARVMKAAGFTAAEIAAMLRDGQGYTAEQVAKTLKALGFSSEDIGVALRLLRILPMEIARALKAAGFDVVAVARGVRAAYALDSGQMRDLLEALGYSQVDIASAMRSVYGIQVVTTIG